MSIHRALAYGALVLVASAALPDTASGIVLPEGFQEKVVLSGLDKPSTFTIAPDGRVLVAEKSGIIKIFDGFGDMTPVVFADLRTQVHNFWDRGLLGIAVHPSFPSVPYVYVLYTYDAPPGGTAPTWGVAGATTDGCPTPPGATTDGCVVQGRLSRLTASGNTWTGQETVLITDWCQQFPSHSIGTVVFGPDGALYVGAGDGASFNFVDYGQTGIPLNPCGDPPAGVSGVMTPPTAEGGALRAQDLLTSGDAQSLDGAILRIDPDTGEALPDNPLYGGATAGDDRIIATGLRNPYRFSFRPGTSQIWIGDVGWGKWEEINVIADPTDGIVENFGWPCYEGNGTQPGYSAAGLNLCNTLYATPGAVKAPFFAYEHQQPVVPGDPCGAGEKGSAVGNIVFYGGGTYPAQYKNAMFFSDFSRSCVWAMFPDANGNPSPSTRFTFAADVTGLVDIRSGPGGDLYYVNYFGGTINTIEHFAQNAPPTAHIVATPTNGAAPLSVDFDGGGSTDPNPADQLTMSWDLDGDGGYGDSTIVAPSYTYVEPGSYKVSLRVSDASGATNTASVTITVDDTPPVAAILLPAAGTTFAVGDAIAFEGAAVDAQDGELPPEAFHWSLVQLHCPDECHQHPVQEFDGVASGQVVAPDHEYPSHLTLTLVVTDSSGLQDQETIELQPDTVVLSFASAPPGLVLAVGSDAGPAPFGREVIVGSQTSVGVESPQTMGGISYKLVGWSDGGAASHVVIAPAQPATYTATFAIACGDGVLDAGEQCDPGPGGSPCCAADCMFVSAGTACNDGNPCTTGTTCSGGFCTGGSGLSCGDGNRCTDDSCEPGVGCIYMFNEAACSDGDKCTTGDACSDGACAGGAAVSCTDGNPCTSDACDPRRGCTLHAVTGSCDDGDLCTGSDRCLGGACTGRPVSCDDDNPCTADACQPATGCVHTPIPGCAWSDGCTPSAEPGCVGCTCEQCVCAIDSLCCHVAWDAECAATCATSCGQSCP